MFQAKAKGLKGLGPKEAESNFREFTEDQMKAGRNVIGEHLLIHEVPIWYFEFFCEQTSVSINFCSSRESGLKKNPLKVKSSSTELDFSLI